ncbi:hypothetical protein ABEB36_008167 [Hypothenemus hampei]|uniref:Protein male-specific lethal-3 n=1 Tax=Hypothenemus hampei TaxID=57062 RepID=A0ABD1EKY6_HYPHA
MVSTRGIKLKFFVGERVLCYEPDPTKAKVLYDSKVLDIVIQKEHTGKKIVEYLIHFQGWNSSWDRRVGEEYVLKDTAENRQLQKDLAEKAQLQLGAYLYRKERKKHQKPLDRTTGSSEDGSSGSPARIDTDDNPEMSSSSDEHSSNEDETIEIEIVPELREILEADYYLINGKNRRLRLPAVPNVVSILESYYRNYVNSQFCDPNGKSQSRSRNSFHKETKIKASDIQKNIILCQEVLDGLRSYFDFSVNDLLLYRGEKDQFTTCFAKIPSEDASGLKLNIKVESNNSYCDTASGMLNGMADPGINSRRRTLRSKNKIEPQTNGNSVVAETNGSINRPHQACSSNSEVNDPMTKALSWRLLPESIYNQQPPPPCLVYGAIHFTRLFVKLPELLMQSAIPDNKLKIILPYVDSIIEFLNDHKEWFGEKFYIDMN